MITLNNDAKIFNIFILIQLRLPQFTTVSQTVDLVIHFFIFLYPNAIWLRHNLVLYFFFLNCRYSFQFSRNSFHWLRWPWLSYLHSHDGFFIHYPSNWCDCFFSFFLSVWMYVTRLFYFRIWSSIALLL